MSATGPMIGLALLWGLFRLAEYLRYRDDADVYPKVLAGKPLNKIRPGDHWFQLASMGATWCEILFVLAAFSSWPHVISGVLAVIIVGGRFRALQEIGHTALHSGFGPKRSVQWAMADWLGHYLLWKPDAGRRFQSHCVQHHPQAASEADPNVARLRRIGLVPGITGLRFVFLCFFPLTPSGVLENFTLAIGSVADMRQLGPRLAMNALVSSIVWRIGGGAAVAVYFAALLLSYPLYSWWSLLVEHRWFVDADMAELTRTEYECRVARRTVYAPGNAWLVRILICPHTDCFHLAHHLFPRLHWKYIGEADRALASKNRAYAAGANRGLLVPWVAGTPSALGDLYHRLVRAGDHRPSSEVSDEGLRSR